MPDPKELTFTVTSVKALETLIFELRAVAREAEEDIAKGAWDLSVSPNYRIHIWFRNTNPEHLVEVDLT